MEIELLNNHFILLPQRAVYWREQAALILSDLHIGKSMHFRKGGIPIPHGVLDDDLQQLSLLIEQHRPQLLMIVGDMFHSTYNNEVGLFNTWRVQFASPEILLVEGNHDILSDAHYAELNIRRFKTLEIESFIFSHKHVDHPGKFCFSGHIHPGIRVNGPARQSLTVPCFHFTPQSCTLPAFGKFTGLALVNPKSSDKIYAVVGMEVIALH